MGDRRQVLARSVGQAGVPEPWKNFSGRRRRRGLQELKAACSRSVGSAQIKPEISDRREDIASGHRLPAFARDRPTCPAVGARGADAEHPALADQGLLFRQASGGARLLASRAAPLTGEYSHTNGMLGLAHRGYRLADYDHHLVHTLREAGYTSTLIGEQHLSVEPEDIGYDHVVELDSHHAARVGPAAARVLRGAPREPFFLSVGFFETHRDFFEPTSVRDALYSLPPANLPDTPETRRDMAAYKASARSLDQGVGTVLDALEQEQHARDLHHRPRARVPRRQGDADRSRDRRAADPARARRLHGGKVSDALVSQVDLFPTICELVGIERPAWLRGSSLLRARPTTRCLRRSRSTPPTSRSAPCARGATSTSGATRTVTRPVLPNIDDSPSKDSCSPTGWRSGAGAGGALRPRLRPQRGVELAASSRGSRRSCASS